MKSFWRSGTRLVNRDHEILCCMSDNHFQAINDQELWQNIVGIGDHGIISTDEIAADMNSATLWRCITTAKTSGIHVRVTDGYRLIFFLLFFGVMLMLQLICEIDIEYEIDQL